MFGCWWGRGGGGGVAGLGGDLGSSGGGGGVGNPWRLGRCRFSWWDWGRATGRTRGEPPGAQVNRHVDPGVAILTV